MSAWEAMTGLNCSVVALRWLLVINHSQKCNFETCVLYNSVRTGNSPFSDKHGGKTESVY